MELPNQMPGLDIEKALSHISGRVELYVKLLRLFDAHHRMDVARLSEANEQKDYKEVGIIAHTLKGVSGNIGASDVYQACQSIEQKIKASQYDILDDLQSLREYFSHTLASIEELLETADN